MRVDGRITSKVVAADAAIQMTKHTRVIGRNRPEAVGRHHCLNHQAPDQARGVFLAFDVARAYSNRRNMVAPNAHVARLLIFTKC